MAMTTEQKARARSLAELAKDVMVALTCAAAGRPQRLIDAKWKGRLDADIACLVCDIRRSA